MTAYSVRKMLVNPRLGRRRCSGIWPPSKPRIKLEPVREPWPLCPRVEVLPMPDPMPRPTRLLPVLAFLGARKFDRFFAMIFLAVAPSEFFLLRRLALWQPLRLRMFAADSCCRVATPESNALPDSLTPSGLC